MADKTSGKIPKNTSRKKETEQKSSQKASTVTPIDQAGVGQSQTQGRQSQGPSQSRSNESSANSGPSESSPRSAFSQSSQSSSQTGAHPSADQSGVAKAPSPIAKNIGSSPSVLNPGGSVQEGRHAQGMRPSGQELHERIRARAYELFEQRGRREGLDQEDWAQAEAEVLAEFEREKSA